MARKSLIAREAKRRKMIERFAKKRQELKEKGEYAKLHLLPKNSSRTRLKNRCTISGRPRGYMRFFGISRIAFRELASEGEITGVKKASW
ncbi:30S ribosomal protein S14 [Candidatus Peregrinibacteria bacterium]|nr:MAG: 30S ribosomal protein S14 [Candidatus Peregrinibacteria bacterium]